MVKPQGGNIHLTNSIMTKISSILPAVLLTLSVVGCDKDKTAVVTNTPDIQFGLHIANPTGTKALLESADLLTTGTQVQVYGFATAPIQGHIGETPGSTNLNSGQTLQYGSDGKWSFVSGEKYRWNYNQDHKFFGWLTKDAKPSTALTATGFFGSGFAFNSSTNTLTIPTKTLGISATNFDFAYSDIVTRSAGDADYSTVELSLNHLFSSFSLSARNYSTKQVTITGIELHGLQDNKSATINYSGTDVVVNYAGGNVTNPTLLSTNLVLAAAGSTGDSKANVVGTPSTTAAYFLVWPQTRLTYDGDNDADGRPNPSSSQTDKPYIKITYTQDGESTTAYAAIPSDDGVWSAGVRYELELAFQDREIDLTFKAAYWDLLDPIIDYDGAVSVTQKLHLAKEFYNNCTLSADGKTAYFKPGIPIILEFAIGTPMNATWLVGEELDWDAFDVYNYPDGARTDPDQIVTAQGLVDGNTVRIAIDPPTKNLQKNESNLELTFSVRLNNGDIVSINPEDIFADNDDVDNDGEPETCPTRFVYIKM